MKRKSILNLLILNRYINLFAYTIIFSFILTTRAVSEIKLIIEGGGNQALLNATFNKDPSEVIVNEESRSNCKKSCNLPNIINYITLKFDDYITSCDNMFYGVNNIIEIDLSNFNTRRVTSMCSMFRECVKLTSITFGNIVTSNVRDMQSIFRDCKSLKSIDVSKFDTSSLTNALELFSHCESLISMDLTNFKTTKVTNIQDLFAYCYKLVSVNLSSFDTSKVGNMRGIFFCCYKLKYIDLSNFSASSLTNFWYTFSYCGELIYLNLRNFKISNAQNVDLLDTFAGHSTTTKYCIEDAYTKNYLLGDITVDCSDFCFQENVVVDLNNNKCICKSNYNYRFNNGCYLSCPEGTYHSDCDFTCNLCYSLCKKCSKAGDNSNHNCDECKEGYTFINDIYSIKNYCYNKCPKYYHFYFSDFNQAYLYECLDNCNSKNKKLIEPKKKCIDDCKNDNEYIYEYNNNCLKVCPEGKKTYEKEKKCLDSCYDIQFEYNNICYDDCPKNTYRLFNIRNICVDSVPGNYYLDNNDKIYKKCYDRCKTCNQSGNAIIHNCIQCLDDYRFLNDSFAKENNCYNICPYYYYFDEHNQYECTQNDECPSNYNLLINSRNKCIDDCKKDTDYIYEYNNN